MIPSLTTDDHADRGLADPKLSGQIFLEFASFVSTPNLAYLSFSQSGTWILATSVGGAVPNSVSLVFSRSAITEVGQSVDQDASRSMSDLLSLRTWPKESLSNKEMNMVMTLSANAIGQSDLPVSPVGLGSMWLSVLAHDAAWPRPGVCVTTSGSSPDSAVQGAYSSQVRHFVDVLVSGDGQPILHAVHSTRMVYFDFQEEVK